MNWQLRALIEDSVKSCPLGCGWTAKRKIKPGALSSAETLLPSFIARCRLDIAVHLLEDHGASQITQDLEQAA